MLIKLQIIMLQFVNHVVISFSILYFHHNFKLINDSVIIENKEIHAFH